MYHVFFYAQSLVSISTNWKDISAKKVPPAVLLQVTW